MWNVIIEFLLDNIVFVVIALGVIAKLLGLPGTSKERPRRMPDFGGGHAGKPAEAPVRKAHTTAEAQPKPVYTPVERRDESEEEWASPALAAVPVRHTAPIGPQTPDNRRAEAVREVSPDGSALPANASDLRRAVIWAEVLGPPKAKRMYRK
ncbi:hypothetical protein ACFSL6_00180 [Paenibacillus thailandensis]|uniref:Uncharacterized protein n=1 Tax=Paenibacillus thailandensis TaxID=393250 RepID=A0ABW5QZS5_9BACL